MSQNLDHFRTALDVFRSVAERMPTDSWDNQSCCSEWTAREAAGHASGVLQRIAGTAGDNERSEAEIAGDDPGATMIFSADAAEAAMEAADLSEVMESPFGKMPVDDFLGIIFVDPATHAWDIADAGGIDSGITPEFADLARAALQPLADTLRGLGAFGPALPEPDGDPVGAFIAFTGRQSVNP
jgi:uncharacterized protein (TIGR03086 family)